MRNCPPPVTGSIECRSRMTTPNVSTDTFLMQLLYRAPTITIVRKGMTIFEKCDANSIAG